MNNSLFVNTSWNDDPEIFIGTVTSLREFPNGDALPVVELQIENSFEHYVVVMSQPHPAFRLTEIPDSAVQLMLWTARDQYAVSRSDTVILLDTPYTLLHLPQSKLCCPDTASDIELFMADCPVQPFAEFVRRIIGRPSVGIRFLNAPSDCVGQATEGGLALHSLNIAKRTFYACHGWPTRERWLAATAALLHGLGRIELQGSTSTDKFAVVLKTLGLLSGELIWLAQTDPEAAEVIQSIIASMYRIGNHYQAHPAASVIQTSHLVATYLQKERTVFV